MIFNKHSELEGRHAILSPSKHYWLNYDDEGLMRNYISSFATDIGTLVHEYASDRIKYRLPIDIENEEAKNGLLMHLLKNGIPFRVIDLDRLFYNLVPYVNDAIGYRMASMDQLLCYAGLFFLEYKRDYRPQTMKVELRIYQNQEVLVNQPSSEEVKAVMDKIIHGDAVLSKKLTEV